MRPGEGQEQTPHPSGFAEPQGGKAPQREPQVSQELNRQSTVVSELGEIVDRLIERLEIITAAPEPKIGGEPAAPGGIVQAEQLVHLAETLQGNNSVIQTQNHRLRDLLRRIEL